MKKALGWGTTSKKRAIPKPYPEWWNHKDGQIPKPKTKKGFGNGFSGR